MTPVKVYCPSVPRFVGVMATGLGAFAAGGIGSEGGNVDAEGDGEAWGRFVRVGGDASTSEGNGEGCDRSGGGDVSARGGGGGKAVTGSGGSGSLEPVAIGVGSGGKPVENVEAEALYSAPFKRVSGKEVMFPALEDGLGSIAEGGKLATTGNS
jgi:hypothetical protein